MNAALCLGCRDIIRSYSRHDYVSCLCGNVFVDGGEDYYRFGFGRDGLVSMVMIRSDELYWKLIHEVEKRP